MGPALVLDDLPCAAVQTDETGRVLAANRELGRLLSRSPSELLNQSFDELLTKSSQIFLETHVRPMLQRDGEVSELVLKLRSCDGGEIPLLVNIRAETNSATTVHTWALFESRHRNEFERELIHAREAMRQMADELQNELRMKNRLLTILAHDLRGPVGSSAQLIDMVVSERLKDESMEEALGLVQGSMHATYNLIENLMGWMEGQNKKSFEEPEPVILHDLLQMVVTWLLSQARAKSISFEVQCHPTQVIRTNRGATETIVRNLTSNALKYSRVGGLVVLTGQETATGWSIEVRDNGVGVPPEKLAKLFGETKVDSSPGTGHERGSGLGLMFCSELARNLGGTLGAGNNPTGGSTFRLRVSRA
jgi:signal transduction histidine kinase